MTEGDTKSANHDLRVWVIFIVIMVIGGLLLSWPHDPRQTPTRPAGFSKGEK